MYLQAYWKNYVIDNSLQYMFILNLNLNTKIITQNSIYVQMTLEKKIYIVQKKVIYFLKMISLRCCLFCVYLEHYDFC